MKRFILPTLKYKYGDLEPYIDAATVELHYSKHHQTYLDKLNTALEKYPNLPDKDILELLKNLNVLPEDIRASVKNMGGGYYNHNLYWGTLTPEGSNSKEMEEFVLKQWPTWNDFKSEFVQKATMLFGSGWVWLVQNPDKKLEILQVPNQDIPQERHLLAIDLWEHAYYLKYQNRRPEYIEAWWKIVDWKNVFSKLIK